MPHSTYLADQMGSATLEPTGSFEAGSYGSFTLAYTAGPFGIDDSGGIKISFRTTTDMGKPQFTDPKGRNYTTAEASNGAALHLLFDRINIRPWVHTLYVRLIGGFLRAGEKITVRFGDRRQGSEGIRLQTNAETYFPFKVYVDAFATYDFTELPDSPAIDLVPGPVSEWRVIAPTLRRPDEKFRLALVKLDRWGNPGASGGGRFTLTCTLPVKGLPERIAVGPDEGTVLLDELAASQPGDLVVALTDEAGNAIARSNPTRVVAGNTSSYWSDFHGQSGETVGSGTARDYFAFARDQALLDIVGHQGNDFQITEAFWDELNRLTREFQEPGRFVTMPGYEWSGNTGVGGDRNVFFKREGRVIHRSSHALVTDGRDGNTAAHTATDLFSALADQEAVTFAHVGGRYADIAVGHDGRIERSVEIHSTWGTFEWLLHDAFRLGYRVGVVCNSDDHKGRPGLASPGASLFGAIGGLTCLRLPALTRDHVFEALRRRHHYGTTGTRLHLDIRASFDEGEIFDEDPSLGPAASGRTTTATMGDIVRTRGPVRLAVDVAAPAPIEKVDIFRGTELIATRRPYDASGPSRRLRVIWEGAEYRGRGRQVTWDGEARLTGNRALRAAPVNFLNPERRLTADGGTHLRWASVTTGNLAGMELWLDDASAGKIAISTKPASPKWKIAEIGYQETVVEAGGLGRRIRAYRLPEENTYRAFAFSLDVPVAPERDNPIYARVTLEDGHQAWSSPLYVIP